MCLAIAAKLRGLSFLRHLFYLQGLMEAQPSEQDIEQPDKEHATSAIPAIIINGSDQGQPFNHGSLSSTETEMSSSHRSSHQSSSKGKHVSSKSKSKKDDWSDITDPEERRRVQNRIAQRKFRDKAKETKERQERDAENRAHAGHSYHTPDPCEMGTDDELSGLPWGSLSLKHVVSRGKAKEEESRRGSRTGDRSRYDSHEPLQDNRDGYFEHDSTYDEGDRTYYDYGSQGSSSR